MLHSLEMVDWLSDVFTGSLKSMLQTSEKPASSKYTTVAMVMHQCMHACTDACAHTCTHTHAHAQHEAVPHTYTHARTHTRNICMLCVCVCVCVCAAHTHTIIWASCCLEHGAILFILFRTQHHF